MSFAATFARATGGMEPYPYQERLAHEPWPDVLCVPTGLGKTAGVGIAWIYRRLRNDPDTPRRLVFLLPMRVLAEQTVTSFRTWLRNLGVLGRPGEGSSASSSEKRISVSLLMGGEEDVSKPEWAMYPEEDAILVGTQDMLLSRALLRGYGMSRYQWPVHFALLHNDALWVFDEVQLMGPALATSAQLEAFRRSFPLAISSRSLWLSATLQSKWLGTVDFRPQLPRLRVMELSGEDRARAGHLLTARKALERAPFRLEKGTVAGRARSAQSIAELALNEHKPGTQTLVIVNRVNRAQAIYRALRAASEGDPSSSPTLLLLHARFRPADRRRIEAELRKPNGPTGRIVVATQAVEAGVDISSATLISELAPWTSMVQRFGRNNRYAELESGGRVIWIDSACEEDEALARPYTTEELIESRSRLLALNEVGIQQLPRLDVERRAGTGPVLRRKDFLQLFDTDPDLSGYDIDIAPYIRDQNDISQVQVFWRLFDGKPGPDEPAPQRDELCTASLSQLVEYAGKSVRKTQRTVWTWDPVLERWRERDGKRSRFVPGMVHLLRADLGGYDPELGFDPEHTDPVPVPPSRSLEMKRRAPDAYGRDPDSEGSGRAPETLSQHLTKVRDATARLAGSFSLVPDELTRALLEAALWHDVGKAHPAFQTAMRDVVGHALPGEFIAKSGGKEIPRYRVIGENQVTHDRRHFRHELASALAWLFHNRDDPDRDLVAYLIAAHHGKVRMGLRALPTEKAAPDGRRYARGVWEGDLLPAIQLPAIGTETIAQNVPETQLSLRIMELGHSADGPSWTERTHRLVETLGPFRLAWLEAMLRVADWRASALPSDSIDATADIVNEPDSGADQSPELRI